MSPGSWWGRSLFTDLTFKDFPSVTVNNCASNKQHVIGLNKFASDYV